MIKENRAIKLIKFIKDNYCEEEDSSFCDGILYLRQHANWEELNSEFLSYFMDMLNYVKRKSHKAAIIENIVEIQDFDFNNNQKLLDEYIHLLLQKATTNDKATQCLDDFACLGANEDEICNKLVKYLDPKDTMEILVKMDRENYWNEISSIPKEFSEKLNITEKIRY